MKIRRDTVLVSSVFLTVAFLLLVPPSWENAQAGHNKAALANMGPGFADYAVLLGELGVANLTTILVALIVIWKAYIRKLRWAWFALFIFVWGWYFPLFVLPGLGRVKFAEFVLYVAHPFSWSFGPPMWVMIFILMLVGLILPLKSFWGIGVAPTSKN